MKTRTVKPCGMLYSHGREYFLTQRHPTFIIYDNQQRGDMFEWWVVPRKIVDTFEGKNIYPHERVVHTNSFTLDFGMTNMPEINIMVLDEWEEWKDFTVTSEIKPLPLFA